MAIVLLFSGLRIGEAAFTEEDYDFETGIVTIDKALQYNNLKVEDFHFAETKTINGERKVAMPKVARQAIERAIRRSREFDLHSDLNPSDAFTRSESIFRIKQNMVLNGKNTLYHTPSGTCTLPIFRVVRCQ